MSSKRLVGASPEQTAERVARFVSAHFESQALARGAEDTYLKRLEQFRRARRSARRLAIGTAMAAALAVMGAVALRFMQVAPPPLSLSYRVDNREPPTDGYILVPQAAQSLVTFSDGSKVRLEPKSRGRVLDLNHRGATFAIEDGRVLVDIVPRTSAQWIFKAGPFRVSVHGTSFVVTWNPHRGIFEVSLTSGAISVASPIGGPEIQVREGQSLRVSLLDQTSTVEPMGRQGGSPPKAAASTTIEATELPSVGPVEAAEPKLAEPPGWSHRGWIAALSGNHAAEVVADASRSGLESVLELADSDDLWALANAARYVGRFPLASQALLAQRKRFASSARAREAAFLLGRLHDGDPGGPDEAIGWYDRYLVEAPLGKSASDAFGRKMTLLQRWHRGAEARDVARDYLKRFPQGTYANAARAVVRTAMAAQ